MAAKIGQLNRRTEMCAPNRRHQPTAVRRRAFISVATSTLKSLTDELWSYLFAIWSHPHVPPGPHEGWHKYLQLAHAENALLPENLKCLNWVRSVCSLQYSACQDSVVICHRFDVVLRTRRFSAYFIIYFVSSDFIRCSWALCCTSLHIICLRRFPYLLRISFIHKINKKNIYF